MSIGKLNFWVKILSEKINTHWHYENDFPCYLESNRCRYHLQTWLMLFSTPLNFWNAKSLKKTVVSTSTISNCYSLSYPMQSLQMLMAVDLSMMCSMSPSFKSCIFEKKVGRFFFRTNRDTYEMKYRSNMVVWYINGKLWFQKFQIWK